jgi:predicted RNA polymerase sigma factor
VEGMPRNPGAWLMAIARRRGIDHFRRNKLTDTKYEQVGYEMQARQEHAVPDFDAALDDELGDDLLRLIFTACHPVLSTEARVTLTLKLLAGLTNEEIARAFLSTETTIQQRIVRAKRTLAEKKIPYEVPTGPELSVRLASVLEVIYLIFNEGYSATAGDDWMRPALCEDAQRLGRVLAGLAPNEPEVHGLVALMLINDARREARFADGELVLLRDQDRTLWDADRIEAGRRSLARAVALGGRGPYALQAAIGSLHVEDPVDWTRVASLYGELAEVTGSEVVELNRAAALAEAGDTEAALVLADRLDLDRYHYLHATRAELLRRLGRHGEARDAYDRALELVHSDAERRFLEQRRAELSR